MPDGLGSGTASSPNVADAKPLSEGCSGLTGSPICRKGPAGVSAQRSITAGGRESGAAACAGTVTGQTRPSDNPVVTHNMGGGNTRRASRSFTSSPCGHGCSYQRQLHNLLVYRFRRLPFPPRLTARLASDLSGRQKFQAPGTRSAKIWTSSTEPECSRSAAAAGLRGRPWRIASPPSFLCTPRKTLPGKGEKLPGLQGLEGTDAQLKPQSQSRSRRRRRSKHLYRI